MFNHVWIENIIDIYHDLSMFKWFTPVYLAKGDNMEKMSSMVVQKLDVYSGLDCSRHIRRNVEPPNDGVQLVYNYNT